MYYLGITRCEITSLLFLKLPPRVPKVSIPRSELTLKNKQCMVAKFCKRCKYLAILRKVDIRS